MSKRSHHFRGVGQYAEQLTDLAEGRPAFTGRAQKPFSKEVLEVIAAIKKCQKDSFFHKSKPCSCGWHKKAAARKQARKKAQLDTSGASCSTPVQLSAPTSIVPDQSLF